MNQESNWLILPVDNRKTMTCCVLLEMTTLWISVTGEWNVLPTDSVILWFHLNDLSTLIKFFTALQRQNIVAPLHVNDSTICAKWMGSCSCAGAAHNTVSRFPRTLEDNSIYSSMTAAGVDVMTSSLLDPEDPTKLSHSQKCVKLQRNTWNNTGNLGTC